MEKNRSDAPPKNLEPQGDKPARVLAVDWMRGLVMLIMTLDHASHAFNAGRLTTDGGTLYDPSQPLPVAQFWVRSVTHLCLPMFMFLAGVSLAISVDSHRRRGSSERDIDRHLLGRGAVLVGLDWVWMSWVWSPSEGLMLGALSAIGFSIIAMAWLRRLSPLALLAVGLTVAAASELLCGVGLAVEGPFTRFPIGFFVTGRHFHDVHLMFSEPPLPWFPAIVLGWVCHTEVLSRPSPWRRLSVVSLLSLAVFALVRGLNGYGNMRLYRTDSSLMQIVHVSKYPASLTFLALELGVGVLLLSGLLRVEAAFRSRGWAVPAWTLVFGQASLFFYLMHVHLLSLAAWVSGLYHRGGLTETFLAAGACALVLYPLCRGFSSLKRRYPQSMLRHL